MHSFCIVSTTFPTKESAKAMIDVVLEKNLGACIQLMPIESFYPWNVQVCEESECLMLIKTRTEHYDAIEALIQAHHPYEIPQILQIPIEKGLDAYLAWMEEQTIKP